MIPFWQKEIATIIQYEPHQALAHLTLWARTHQVSDIHIDGISIDHYSLRVRLHGTVHSIATVSRQYALAIIAAAKVQARLPLDEQRLPLDGSWRNQEFFIRIATAPTPYGESCVLRVHPGSTEMTYGSMPSSIAERLSHYARTSPALLVLIVGGTGSGKTTTLYTYIRQALHAHLVVVSVEDPIECVLVGARQIQTHAALNLHCSALVRTVVRHDPDVIAIGEIRDADTAFTAMQAAATGHMVIATMHAHSAEGAEARLRALNADGFIMQHLPIYIVYQTLLPIRCLSCAGMGCEACRGRGTTGVTLHAHDHTLNTSSFTKYAA
jgi:type II secretory ATPase GspE/PulE/Tfp pilus assembly ATPase PilB-like protein